MKKEIACVLMSCFLVQYFSAGHQDTGTLGIQAVVPLLEPFLGHPGTIIVILLEGPTEQISIQKGIRTPFQQGVSHFDSAGHLFLNSFLV